MGGESQPAWSALHCTASLGSELCEMFVTGRGSWVSAVEVVSAAWKEAVRKDLVLLLPMGMAGQSRTWLSAECNLVANLVTNPCRRGSS